MRSSDREVGATILVRVVGTVQGDAITKKTSGGVNEAVRLMAPIKLNGSKDSRSLYMLC